MLETEQTEQHNCETGSSHQSHVYEVCARYGLWDAHIYVAVVAVSVCGGCTNCLFYLTSWLPALCLSHFLCKRENEAPEMVRDLEGYGAPSTCQKNL